MTTYILHGGYYKRDTPDNQKFFEAIAERLPVGSKILFLAHAREKSDWQKRRDMAARQFSDYVPKKKIELVLASDNKDKFIEQLKASEAIFLPGGDPAPLYDFLKKTANLKELIKDKLVIGSSAGSWVLSKYYCLFKTDEICEGLGILPIKTLVHWTEDQSAKLNKLKDHGEDLEIYKIPEEKFIVVEY